MFLHHLENLPETALAKEVFKIQTAQGLPGIIEECRPYLAKFQIFDLKSYSKMQFKKLVKSKILELNKSKLLELVRSKGYKKVDHNELLGCLLLMLEQGLGLPPK